ncbi:MAG: hypothetical protein KC425_13375, partial [Anaerolineales bacterium]|nr:hypothetical protein [Anaerolineales bacterium]
MTPPPPTDTRVPASWLPVVRLAWLACALLLIAGFVLGVPYLHAELSAVCTADCLPYAMTQAEADLLADWGMSLDLYAAYLSSAEIYLALAFTLPALLIFWRKSADWIGVLASLAILFVGLVVMAEELRALARAYPPLFAPIEVLTSVGVLLFMLLFYLFPDGRFAPRWLGYVVAVSSLVILV